MTLLSVRDLRVDFGAVSAVRGISLEVSEGEILGIVGESGSGKSVSCRAILDLLPKRARVGGQILLDGDDLRRGAISAARGRKISMIFQNPSSHLDPLMTIGDHVAEPLRRHFAMDVAEARRESLHLLDAVKIRDAAARIGAYPHQLSGGMKQRVLIASALACQPRLLIADEPTTALDVTVQAEILRLLRSLSQARGLSMILVSHDLGVIAEICDRVMVMRHGEVVEHGPVRQVVKQPRHDYTRLLIGSQPGRLPQMTDAPRQTSPLLQVDRLQVHFPTGGLGRLIGRPPAPIRAVDDVSFEVHAGECFGIVGESGSGKSTIARAVVRLVEATGGDLRFDGRSVRALARDDLARYRHAVQMVFQSPYDSLNPRMSVSHIIAEPIWRHGLASRSVALDRALDLMGMVELPRDLAQRRPRELSGGQCQRVGIARALALSPRLLIADEVTSALDVTIQAQILRLLARLRREHDLTIVYISHDLSVVRRFCDRMAVFQQGQLVELGPTSQVFTAAKSEYTRRLLGAAPDLDAAMDLEAT